MRLAAIEPHGDLVRLRAGVRDGGPAWVDGLAADVTPAAVADLPVEPGAELWFAVKATEVAIHAAGVGRSDRSRRAGHTACHSGPSVTRPPIVSLSRRSAAS